MKDLVLLYDNCCIYEIVTLNYFLEYTKSNILFCSPHGSTVRSMEGYSLNVDLPLERVDLANVRSFIIPGGKIAEIDNDQVRGVIRSLFDEKALIAAICAGVDILEKAGILQGKRSTRCPQYDCVRDGNIITARANAYVDFAIEVAKALQLFSNEADLQETIAFWKEHKRAQ